MRHISWFALGFLSLLAAAPCSAGFVPSSLTQWSIGSGGNGHWYAITSSASTWTNTEAVAESDGGHLVSINSADENEFVRTSFLTGPGETEVFWMGFYSPTGDWTDPSTWQWIDGSSVTYTNWRSGQPDIGLDDGEDDRYGGINFLMSGSGEWDNFPNSAYQEVPGIVEFTSNPVPEPSGLALLGMGMLTLTGWRRHQRRKA